MSRPITWFSGYSQKENRTTNYCLLILKLLYDENPRFLSEVLTTLVGEELGDYIGVKFRQQEKKQSSVPDGLIAQLGFTVYIEAKNFDWFYKDQLDKHLAALDKESGGLKILIALSAFETKETALFEQVRSKCKSLYDGRIVFAQVSFEDFLDAIKQPHLPSGLSSTVSEFRAYLDEENLLPLWRMRLDVVNCAGAPEEIIHSNTYICPAAGGAYNHARCQYFGMYRLKRVEKIAAIEAVVDVEDGNNAILKWSNVAKPDGKLIEQARNKASILRPGRFPFRVFLLGDLYDTNFEKDSPGGMFNSKRYFDVSSINPKNAAELALALNGMKWSRFGNPAEMQC